MKSATKIAEDYLRANPTGDLADLSRAHLKLVAEAAEMRSRLAAKTPPIEREPGDFCGAFLGDNDAIACERPDGHEGFHRSGPRSWARAPGEPR